jgi:hypothetical protein
VESGAYAPRLYIGYIGWAFASPGRADRAREFLEELQELSQDTYGTAFSMALIYLGLGKIGMAFDYFEKAAEEHTGSFFGKDQFISRFWGSIGLFASTAISAINCHANERVRGLFSILQ